MLLLINIYIQESSIKRKLFCFALLQIYIFQLLQFILVWFYVDILKSTNDQKINIVIVDYGSQDLNIKQLLQESSIKNFQVVDLQRNLTFRRAEALQKAADAVNDPNGILFLCDLHLSMPKDLFPLIRQVCALKIVDKEK